MTREEAIKVLNMVDEAKRVAIKALKQEPCEDAISRADIQEYIAKFLSQYLYDDARGAAETIDEYIGEMPSVQPKQKTGHWINAKVGKLFPSNDYKCSECGNILDFDGVNCGRGDANFCPNCGAKMESEEV